MLTTQWFVDAQKLAIPAIKAVEDGKVKFLPEHRYNLFMAWMREIRPWTISRQLWWGHHIPAWYDENGNIYVAETEEEAIKQSGGKTLTPYRDWECVVVDDGSTDGSGDIYGRFQHWVGQMKRQN